MKIGIDARLWNETGVGRYVRNLVKELEKIDTKNDYVLFAREQDVASITHYVSSKNWKIVSVNIPWHSVREQIAFPPILAKENLDVMHFPYFSVPIFYTRPYVVTIHDLIIYHFATGKASTLPLPLYSMKQAGYRMVIKQAVNNAKKIIVPLETIKEDVIQTLNVDPEKIIVTTEGFDDSITNGKSLKGKYFLYVGNAYPHKNLEGLIGGFLAYKEQMKESSVQLYLVGKEDYFYKRLKEKFVNNSDVVFLGEVSDEELASLYSNALAFLSASKMEGFGLPPLEAMASSCLVVVSDISSFKEVCEDAALYFDPMNKESIKDAMIKVLELDKKTKQLLIERGRRRATNFSWGKMAKETLLVYENCISVRQSK